MAEDPNVDRRPLPVFPAAGPTLSANRVFTTYNTGNGSIMLIAADQRFAPIDQLADEPSEAVFELGRFALTPRALRELLDSVNATVRSYEVDHAPLPTNDQFIARAAMTGLSGLLHPPSPPPDRPAS